MNIPYLLTCARDWQRIKQAYALDHAGTADGNQALVTAGASANSLMRFSTSILLFAL